MFIESFTKAERWDDNDRHSLRMFLLSHVNYEENLSWIDVAEFLECRTSTQARTHVQKFRMKLDEYIKLLKGINERLKQEKDETLDEHFLQKSQKFIIVEM